MFIVNLVLLSKSVWLHRKKSSLVRLGALDGTLDRAVNCLALQIGQLARHKVRADIYVDVEVGRGRLLGFCLRASSLPVRLFFIPVF